MISSSEECIDDIFNALMDSQGKIILPVRTPAFLGLALVWWELRDFWPTALLPRRNHSLIASYSSIDNDTSAEAWVTTTQASEADN
jgi:hypothetical protein